MNQLVSVINHISDKKEVYDYDTSGNIVKVSKYNVTTGGDVLQEVINYKYEDSNWGDKLTTYKGQAITYDEIGNPLSYRDGISLEWSNGRQLTKYTKGSNVIQNSYDDSGMRVSKTVNGEKHTYQYVDGKLMYERRGDKSFIYYYDGSSTPYAVRYRSSESSTGAIYYYERNWRGDVTGLYNSSGVKHASYEYDVWGNVTSITDANGDEVTGSTKIAILNPFRYRGYYYDTDMGLYYTCSRYYDAVTHRFVNADGELSGVGGDIQGYNLFAYCFNNPVNMSDFTGNWPKWLDGALNIVGGVLEMAAGAVIGIATSWSGVGAAAACVLIGDGASTVVQGIGQTVNAVTNSNVMREDNITKTITQSIGGTVGETMGGVDGEKTGETIAGTLYDTTVTAASVYGAVVSVKPHVVTSLDAKMPQIVESKLFSYNNGYGIKIGKNIEMFYRNPNATGGVGGTIFSYKGSLGKFRIDWDPTYGFHSHPPGHR